MKLLRNNVHVYTIKYYHIKKNFYIKKDIFNFLEES